MLVEFSRHGSDSSHLELGFGKAMKPVADDGIDLSYQATSFLEERLTPGIRVFEVVVRIVADELEKVLQRSIETDLFLDGAHFFVNALDIDQPNGVDFVGAQVEGGVCPDSVAVESFTVGQGPDTLVSVVPGERFEAFELGDETPETALVRALESLGGPRPQTFANRIVDFELFDLQGEVGCQSRAVGHGTGVGEHRWEGEGRRDDSEIGAVTQLRGEFSKHVLETSDSGDVVLGVLGCFDGVVVLEDGQEVGDLAVELINNVELLSECVGVDRLLRVELEEVVADLVCLWKGLAVEAPELLEVFPPLFDLLLGVGVREVVPLIQAIGEAAEARLADRAFADFALEDGV